MADKKLSDMTLDEMLGRGNNKNTLERTPVIGSAYALVSIARTLERIADHMDKMTEKHAIASDIEALHVITETFES